MKLDKKKAAAQARDKAENKKDPRQFREMINKFNSNQGGLTWGDTETIKFNVGEFYEALHRWIDAGRSEFTIQLATYDSEANAAEYAERRGEEVGQIVDKVTILIANPDVPGDYIEVAKICPPPQDCDYA